VEEAIQEAKQCLGFETTQGWCSPTVNRQAPLAMVLVTLVKAWYARRALESRGCGPNLCPGTCTRSNRGWRHCEGCCGNIE